MIDFLLQPDITSFVWINSHNTTALDLFFGLATQLGNGWLIAPVIMTLIFMRVPRPLRSRTFGVVVLSMALSGVVNWQVKVRVNRPRPIAYFESLASSTNLSAPGHDSKYVVHAVGHRYRRHSFPSGHTNTAFSAGVVLTLLFGRRFFAAFAVAGLVAYSRVYVGAHFPLDTVAGGLLGIGVTAVCMLNLRRFSQLDWRPSGIAPEAEREG